MPWARSLIGKQDEGKRLSSESESEEVSEDDEGIASVSRRKSQRIRLCRELSDLIPQFLQLKTVNDLMATAPNSQTMNPRRHIAYLSETIALRLTHTYAPEFAQTSRDYVVCVSPNVTRTDSSNVNPQEFWNHGIQMVEINYQTPGLMMDLQVSYSCFSWSYVEWLWICYLLTVMPE
ncbi:unnamed protein product [Strongylus vulgaris]|uniref:Phosphoinositide phospholipase C n=1 Tax=Strongylus vulgaris TaxID=40348 RepID=A0A3P7KWY2_STRVU|nr:unnamed protein product [Strongylus vulgaris]